MSDGHSDYVRTVGSGYCTKHDYRWSLADTPDCALCGSGAKPTQIEYYKVTSPAEPQLFPGDRKQYPVFTGLLMYFPNACAAVARCSLLMNEQHNPGEPPHWDKSKSVGTGDETVRHLMDCAAGTPPQVIEIDGVPHTVDHAANHAWRAMEFLERLILKQRG